MVSCHLRLSELRGNPSPTYCPRGRNDSFLEWAELDSRSYAAVRLQNRTGCREDGGQDPTTLSNSLIHCVCVCMCVCVHACACVCVCVYECVCMVICLLVYVYMYVCVYTIHMHKHTSYMTCIMTDLFKMSLVEGTDGNVIL